MLCTALKGTMENEFLKRMEELALRAENRGVYSYSEFLSPTKLAEANQLSKITAVVAFGGAEFAERKVLRFGDFGYDEEYPIKILFIKPVNKKFAKAVSHRDFLGALLNLGIERDRVGDIFVKDNEAYIPVSETLCDFICDSLERVGANTVECRAVDVIPAIFAPEQEELTVSVASVRLDAIISRVYNLSREEGAELFKEGRVFANGRQIDAPSFTPSIGDVITVRGYGKATYGGECGKSARGKLRIKVNRFK